MEFEVSLHSFILLNKNCGVKCWLQFQVDWPDCWSTRGRSPPGRPSWRPPTSLGRIKLSCDNHCEGWKGSSAISSPLMYRRISEPPVQEYFRPSCTGGSHTWYLEDLVPGGSQTLLYSRISDPPVQENLRPVIKRILYQEDVRPSCTWRNILGGLLVSTVDWILQDVRLEQTVTVNLGYR